MSISAGTGTSSSYLYTVNIVEEFYKKVKVDFFMLK